MGITVISLDRTPDRFRQFTTVNAHLQGIERFSAIDGQQLSWDTLREQGMIEGNPQYTPGAMGLFLSHLAQWKQAVATGQARTIAEDDAIFSHDFEASQRSLIESAGPNWDFILWGWNFDVYLWVDLIPGVSPAVIRTFQDRLRGGIAEFQDLHMDRKLLRLLHFFGTACYSVSPRGAQRLIDFCTPLRPLLIPFHGFDVVIENRGVDHMLNGVVRDLNAFVSMPPLVVSENRHEESTVHES